MRLLLLTSVLFAFTVAQSTAQDDYKPGPDSTAQPNVPKGQLIKGTYTAKDGSVFPGTERGYDIYLPVGYDKSKADQPAPFMVFQDGVIYNAPIVFDNLIAKHELPPLIGIFIKPGIVPAANPNALPRYNRSYEYDSVSDTYARFLIDEFLPAIEARHHLQLSTDPNDAATCGNSSGGICAFMTAWHRPDRFRRVFSGVGTYVGIHGADQLPVLVRKIEPKPLRIYLQSGEHDNNLYCGDWWMANQTMERALTWAGYDCAHTWGTGGHNAKHATALFPDVLRWLWRDYSTAKEIKPNPRGDSKWLGYSVLGDGKWETVVDGGIAWPVKQHERNLELLAQHDARAEVPTYRTILGSTVAGDVFAWLEFYGLCRIRNDEVTRIPSPFDYKQGAGNSAQSVLAIRDGSMTIFGRATDEKTNDMSYVRLVIKPDGKIETHTQLAKRANKKEQDEEPVPAYRPVSRFDGFALGNTGDELWPINPESALPIESKELDRRGNAISWASHIRGGGHVPTGLLRGFTFSPDQSLLYISTSSNSYIHALQIMPDGKPGVKQAFFQVEGENAFNYCRSMCVDTNGWLYVATPLGIQVCDQAGRVNFIIPTPNLPQDICFGGKDLGELFIACGDKIYKRPTKAHGIVSGQMAPIKPAPPKL